MHRMRSQFDNTVIFSRNVDVYDTETLFLGRHVPTTERIHTPLLSHI